MPGKNDPQVRLDSWKEIAAYLGRGERTVKRWEGERGLPVHRVPGGRGSVYAFTEELDEWLRSERDKPAQDVPDSPGEIPAAVSYAEPLPSSFHAPETTEPQASEDERPVVPRQAWLSSRVSLLVLVALVLTLVTVTLASLNGLRSFQSGISPRLRSLLSNTSHASSASDSSNPEKAQARELYLRGRYEWNKRTPESLDRAADLFTQALVHDPSFAQAYVGLADTYNLKREFAGMPEKEAYARSIAAARKAIELDDSLAEAHRSLAFALTNGEWDFVNGEKEYLRAIELNPADPITHLWYANSYQGFEPWDTLLAEIDRAQKLDPSSSAILADKGNALFNAGKTEEAIQLLKQVERGDPQFLAPHKYLARIAFATRNYTLFLEESQRVAELTNDSVLRGHIAAAKSGFARAGELGLLQDLYTAQKVSLAHGEMDPGPLALTCVMAGKKDEALSLMAEDLKNRSGYAVWLIAFPNFVALKEEPRYQELVSQFSQPPLSRLPSLK